MRGAATSTDSLSGGAVVGSSPASRQRVLAINGLEARLAAAALLVVTAAACERAPEDFPSRPIEVVTHASPGGGTDATARAMLVGARQALDQDMAVMFKGGGGGVVAMSYVASRPRDGHTILALTPTHLLTMARGQGNVRIDDLVGLVRATDDPLVVSVRAEGGIETLEDLLALGRERPLRWGTGLVGGGDHLAGVLLTRAAGADMNAVPFAGGGEVAAQLIGGSIDAAGLNITESLEHFERGSLKALAVMAEERLSAIPEVPTTVELGIDVTYTTVRGYAVLKGTPEDRIATLERGLLVGLRHETFTRYLRGVGLSEQGVAGREVWDAQLKRLHAEARRALAEVGMLDD